MDDLDAYESKSKECLEELEQSLSLDDRKWLRAYLKRVGIMTVLQWAVKNGPLLAAFLAAHPKERCQSGLKSDVRIVLTYCAHLAAQHARNCFLAAASVQNQMSSDASPKEATIALGMGMFQSSLVHILLWPFSDEPECPDLDIELHLSIEAP